jgi:hypothetical protein
MNMVSRASTADGFGHRRRAVRLGAVLEKSLSAYAVAATGAGVSLLALASSAEARIVYTPASTNIPVNGGAVLLDLNHDGIADFSFLNSRRSFSHNGAVVLFAGPKDQSNQIWGKGVCFSSIESHACASALRPGFRVRPSRSYFQKGTLRLMGALSFSFSYSGTNGQWLYTKNRYLGLKFVINGQIHYGWARFTVTPINAIPTEFAIHVVLTGYAYETIPNKPIITGKIKGPDVITLEPATLGHLAQGASGISAWRKSGGTWKSAAH